MKIKLPRKSRYKVFRPLGRVVRSNREVLCLSDGYYFVIRFAVGHVPHPSVFDHPNFRFVLQSDFVLYGTLFGVPRESYVFEDICCPRQVVLEGKIVKIRVSCETERVG